MNRLCTVTVTRLEVRQALEPSLPSVVVAVAMKTPHRFLRSNEIPLPPSGTLDIPLQLTFALQVHLTPLSLSFFGSLVQYSAVSLCVVPSFPEERRQHPPDQGPEKKEVSEQSNWWLQDPCNGDSGDVPGTHILCGMWGQLVQFGFVVF